MLNKFSYEMIKFDFLPHMSQNSHVFGRLTHMQIWINADTCYKTIMIGKNEPHTCKCMHIISLKSHEMIINRRKLWREWVKKQPHLQIISARKTSKNLQVIQTPNLDSNIRQIVSRQSRMHVPTHAHIPPQLTSSLIWKSFQPRMVISGRYPVPETVSFDQLYGGSDCQWRQLRWFLNRKVFRLDLKKERLGASRRDLRREFQVTGLT